MKIVLFYHSLLSDWNHGNAHFLRGVAAELIRQGHQVLVLEPAGGWSLSNLLNERGETTYHEFDAHYPTLTSHFYDLSQTDLTPFLEGADLVIVHEWNDPATVKALGDLKARFGYRLLFHDTHHRAVTDAQSMSRYDLSRYDGVLAYGEVLSSLYQKRGWTQRAWTWHEAADTRIFYPRPAPAGKAGDLVWIGNWGDEERTEELIEYLIDPVKELGIKAKMYGVRYPPEALALLAEAGIAYGGYLPSYRVPEVFAQYRFTVHVPRRPYTEALPGIPTIRPFEAMACGIPLLSAPWCDAEGLFSEGQDYLLVQNGEDMKENMKMLLENPALSAQLSEAGLATIQAKHTCAHRVDELLEIFDQIKQEQLWKTH